MKKARHNGAFAPISGNSKKDIKGNDKSLQERAKTLKAKKVKTRAKTKAKKKMQQKQRGK